MSRTGRIIAVMDDLMSSSRISAAASRAGLGFQRIEDAEALVATLKGDPPALVFVDLAATVLDPLDAVRRLREDPAGASIPVIAFGPHVDDERLRAARAAGCGLALPRSAFFRDLPRLIQDSLEG